MLRLGSLALCVCLLVLAGGTAHAAKPRSRAATFAITLTATLTKEWTYTRTVEEGGDCVRTTRGTGRWQAKLSSRRSARIKAIPAGSRIRFVGTVGSLRGSAVQSGATTTTLGGDPACERSTRSVRCAAERKTFSNASSAVRNPRRGVAQLGALRGTGAARSFRCLETPDDIRTIRTDLSLATAPLDSGDVFGRDIRRFFLTGDTEQVTTLEGELEGRVTERVRWTLVFTRLSR